MRLIHTFLPFLAALAIYALTFQIFIAPTCDYEVPFLGDLSRVRRLLLSTHTGQHPPPKGVVITNLRDLDRAAKAWRIEIAPLNVAPSRSRYQRVPPTPPYLEIPPQDDKALETPHFDTENRPVDAAAALAAKLMRKAAIKKLKRDLVFMRAHSMPNARTQACLI